MKPRRNRTKATTPTERKCVPLRRPARAELETEIQRLREERAISQADLELDALREAQRELEESRHHYADLYDFAPLGYLSLDRNGSIRTANVTAANLLGQQRVDLVGRPLLPLIAQPDRRKLLSHLSRLRRGEEEVTTEVRLAAKDQPPIPVQLVSVCAGHGTIARVQFPTAIVDLTERKRAEQVLRAQEAQLRLITNTTATMITRCSRDLRYLFVNRAYAQLLGFAPELIEGKPIVEILGPEAWETIRPHVETVLRGQPVEFETEIHYPHAGQRFAHVTYTPDRDEQGAVVGWVAAITDLTDRRRAEEAMRESENRFRIMADAAPVLIWISGTDKRCTYFNKGWLEFTGRALEQELGDGWAQGVHPDDLPRCLDIYTRSFDARQEFQMEYRLRRRDGEYRWLLDHGVPRFVSADDFAGYIGSCIDITALKQAEEQLRQSAGQLEQRVQERTAQLQESETMLAMLFDSAPDAIVVVGSNNRIVRVNRQVEAFFGYHAEELIGQAIETLLPHRFRAAHARHSESFFGAPRTRVMGAGLQLFGLRKDGSEFPLDISLAPLPAREGTLVMAVIRDNTERKRLEKEIAEISEREQQRFGQEVHDALGQTLTGITLLCESLAQRLRRQSPAEAAIAEKIGLRANQALQESHNLAQNLFPTVLKTRGIEAALQALTFDVGETSPVSCRFVPPHKTVRLRDEQTAIHLYRIAQEAVRNAIKHGKCKNVVVRLTASSGAVSLQIKDDGVGIPANTIPKKNMGLEIMRHRAGRIGAKLDIQSAPNKGTTVLCSLPRRKPQT